MEPYECHGKKDKLLKLETKVEISEFVSALAIIYGIESAISSLSYQSYWKYQYYWSDIINITYKVPQKSDTIHAIYISIYW